MKSRLTWSVVLIVTAAAAGCATKKSLTAEQYFKDANENFRSGALPVAIESYHELLDQYPFSEYSEEAELKIAHAHYLNGNYAEAIVALTDFQRRHPTSSHLPFVGYYLGMCYAQQMRTIDRDQTAAQNAQIYFQTVSREYPESPFAELAREELARCRENLGEHELYVANFYAHYGNEKAEEIRLLTLASLYGETEASRKGLLQLANLYKRTQRDDEAALAYVALAQLHPDQAKVAEHGMEQLALADPPSTRDPVDMLLAANGRQRTTGTFEPVKVPGLEPGRPTRTAVPPVGFGQQGTNPFGRGRYGY